MSSVALKRVDQGAAVIVLLLGIVHLAISAPGFARPSLSILWFASAGFLLLTTGLANLAAIDRPSRLQRLTALSGNLAVLFCGAVLAILSPSVLAQPQSIVLIAVALFLTAMRLRRASR